MSSSVRLLLHASLLLALLRGCAAVLCPALPSGFAANLSASSSLITADNRTRTFLTYLPPSYPSTSSQSAQSATPFPLVLFLHPGLSTARLAEHLYGMDAVASLHSFVVAYPQGLGVESVNSSWNAGGGCCGKIAATGVDDVGFLALVVRTLSASLCIDPAAIFSTGISDGAIMTQRLGCEPTFSPLLAAIAPVDGTLPPTPPFACNSTTPLSVLEVHGTNDTNIPFQGGVGCGASGTAFTSVPTSLTTWTTQQRCSLPYSLTAPNSTDLDAVVYSYGPCAGPAGRAGNVSVELALIVGGGHTWSGAGAQVNGANCSAAVGQWPASAQVWSFFDAHRQAKAGGAGQSSSGGSSSSASTPSTASSTSPSSLSSSSSSSTAPSLSSTGLISPSASALTSLATSSAARGFPSSSTPTAPLPSSSAPSRESSSSPTLLLTSSAARSSGSSSSGISLITSSASTRFPPAMRLASLILTLLIIALA